MDDAHAQARVFARALAVVSAGLVAETVDRSAPGLLIALHLVGSAALGDWWPGQSDLDLLGVLSRRPTPQDQAVLAAALTRSPYKIDAEWVVAADLSAAPATASMAVALRTLALYGQTLRGDKPDIIWDDPLQFETMLRENIATYWARWIKGARQSLSPTGVAMLGRWAPAWGVLGVARIVYTLRTRDITSKSGAGRWSRIEFPDHARIITECLRLRTVEGRKSYLEPFSRKRDALAAMDAMILASQS